MKQDEQWPRDKQDLKDDWDRAMRGYKPNIWDPYKNGAERLESWGLEASARNNMLLKLLYALGFMTALGLVTIALVALGF